MAQKKGKTSLHRFRWWRTETAQELFQFIRWRWFRCYRCWWIRRPINCSRSCWKSSI